MRARFLRTIKEDDFFAAAKSLDLALSPGEKRALSLSLDKKGDGVFDLAHLFTMRPTRSPSLVVEKNDNIRKPIVVDQQKLKTSLDKIVENLLKGIRAVASLVLTSLSLRKRRSGIIIQEIRVR